MKIKSRAYMKSKNVRGYAKDLKISSFYLVIQPIRNWRKNSEVLISVSSRPEHSFFLTKQASLQTYFQKSSLNFYYKSFVTFSIITTLSLIISYLF